MAKRVLSRLEMRLSKDNSIGIKMISNIKRLGKPSAVAVDLSGEKTLKRVNWQRTDTTGQIVQPEDTGKFIEFGGEVIPFSDKELTSVRDLTVEGLTLIGFKHKSALKPYHNVQAPILVLPDDKQFSNSSTAVHALVTEMAAMDKVAIAKVKLLTISSVRFCALVPQLEATDKEGVKQPCGFQLIMLPYADDVRKLDAVYPSSHSEPGKTDIAVAMKLVHNLSIGEFNPKSFENPEMQKFFESLEAMALGKGQVAQGKDLLLPDYEALAMKQAVIDEFNDHFFSREEDVKGEEEVAADTKTKRKAKTSESRSKRQAKRLETKGESSPEHIMELEEPSGMEEDRIFEEEDDDSPEPLLKARERLTSKSKQAESKRNSSKSKEKSKDRGPRSQTPRIAETTNLNGRLRRKSKDIHAALIEKLKDREFGSIRVHELDVYLEDHGLAPRTRITKAEKLKLVSKSAKLKVAYPN